MTIEPVEPAGTGLETAVKELHHPPQDAEETTRPRRDPPLATAADLL